ncbi:MAG: MBL fold metallo-hydrolase, partial [Candidatus Spechtbacterales bacterium]
EAQIVLVTHDHSDHNNAGSLKGSPFIIDGPGEYEYQGIRVKGIRSYHDDKKGADRGANTIYIIRMEGLRVVHLGDLGQTALTDRQVESIGSADVLMIPVGGQYTIDGSEALAIVNQIEPRVVIPMHYAQPGLKVTLDGVETFLKEMGVKDVEAQDKFTIKKASLAEEGKTEVVVLKV